MKVQAESGISDSGDCLVPQSTPQSAHVSPDTDNNIDTDSDGIQISDSGDCIVPNTSNISASSGIVGSDYYSSNQTSVYVVKEGDTPESIAKMSGISVNTLLWANDMKKGDKLPEGTVLIILPVDGVNYSITKGDTLNKIASKYGVGVSDILAVNDISVDAQLTVGQQLIVPGAEISSPVAPKIASKNGGQKNKNNPKIAFLHNVSGYFINPVPDYVRRSQGLHANNGIDLAAPTGTTVVAPADGTVSFAHLGNNGGYGNMILIEQSNGTETLYGHLSAIGVHVGERVSQGDPIGRVGSTGHSTGPHLHFEVHGGKNPGGTIPMTFASR